MRRQRFCLYLCGLALICSALSPTGYGDQITRQTYLEQLQSVLPQERPDRGRVTPLDVTWQDWLERTGELPPDFDAMPSIPFLPDPLLLDEGEKNIPVTTIAQWREKRDWMSKEIQHWITGTFPPPPDNLKASILSEKTDGKITIQIVELRFGPDHKAKITIELYIPPGNGPFPVFLTPGGDGTGWITVAQAVQRGYIGCYYAGCDANDDTEDFAEIWFPDYDFTRLMRRAWGAHRVIDYLYTMPIVDKERIGLTGLSRDGKQVLMAAAFDQRIKAVIPCSGGTGAEDPWRYTVDKFDNETIAEITTNFPFWMHPRLRFFIGREHKLPVDQNLLMALVAPRGLLITSAFFEDQGNPWGIEQNYHNVKRVYEFLGVENKLGLYMRHGYHSPSARDIEVFVDFFDTIFERGRIPVPCVQHYDYSFAKWRGLSGECMDPHEYPEKGIQDLFIWSKNDTIQSTSAWEKKKKDIRTRIQTILGEEPPAISPGRRSDYLNDVIVQPRVRNSVGSRDVLMGKLYFPANSEGQPVKDKFPVVIHLYEYSYPTGFGRRPPLLNDMIEQGFAVYVFNQIGFGNRVEEGTRFYERYPHWSKLGRMIADVRWSVDALCELDFIDKERIYMVGYALGATIGLYSAAFDERIAGIASICGFTPMRLDTAEKGTEGIRAFSHLHGLIPRLGFFVGVENRIPYDFHEILACIAPRPLFVIAPQWDRDATLRDVEQCVEEVGKVYKLYDAEQKLERFLPNDYNHFSGAMQEKVMDWLKTKQ